MSKLKRLYYTIQTRNPEPKRPDWHRFSIKSTDAMKGDRPLGNSIGALSGIVNFIEIATLKNVLRRKTLTNWKVCIILLFEDERDKGSTPLCSTNAPIV